MKAFYCGGTESGYSPPTSFTTGDDCPPMTNLTVSTFNNMTDLGGGWGGSQWDIYDYFKSYMK